MKRLFLFLILSSALAFSQGMGGMAGAGGKAGFGGGLVVASGPSSFAYIASSVTGCYNIVATSQTKCTYALHQTPGAGHLLVLAAWWAGSSATCTITDPNNTWVAVGSPMTGAGALSGFRGQNFYVFSAVSAATTITMTISTGTLNGLGWEAGEYSYSGTLSALDGTPGYSNTAAVSGIATLDGTSMGAALVTANASDLVFASCNAVASACTVGSGYTSRNDTAACNAATGGLTCTNTANNYGTVTGGLVEEKTGVAAGTQTATFGAGTTDAFIGGLVAF